MKCPYCEYEWESRKAEPKACPRCKRRLDIPRKSMQFDPYTKTKDKESEAKPERRAVSRRPSSKEALANSIEYIRMRNKYLQENGILVQTGERTWRLNSRK